MQATEKLDAFKKLGIGGIIRMDRDGKNREVYAWGVRNSIGPDFNPKDEALWFTDNQVDGIGESMDPAWQTQPCHQGRSEFEDFPV